MIDETVTINVLSEPDAISKLTFRSSSGQHGTIALNFFAIYLGTAWTTRLFVNFINRKNYFLYTARTTLVCAPLTDSENGLFSH